MVHIHFDAKYRVTTLNGFEAPGEGDDEAIQDRATAGGEETRIRSLSNTSVLCPAITTATS